MQKHTNYTRMMKKCWVPVAIGGLLAGFLIWTVSNLWYEKPIHTANMMAQDIAKLAEIFEQIEKTCGISSFDYQSNPINFLTIKKDGFVGSEVGSMNLARPEKWQGPYLQDNLEVQEKEYEVVSTKKGYFIVPGKGVELANGKIIGTDIILDENADIAAMMQDKDKLMFEGKPLAAPLVTEKTVVNSQFIAVLAHGEGE